MDLIIGETGKDIEMGVSMNIETLKHKIEMTLPKSELVPYWEIPYSGNESLEESDLFVTKLWVANRGEWVGWFDILNQSHNEIEFRKWNPLPKAMRTPRKPFRGFTYNVPAL